MSSAITSLGLGSGIDVAELVQSLVDAEQEPAEARMETKEKLYDAQISAYGSLKSTMYSFQTAVGKLDTISTFTTKTATSSNEDILTATSTSIADNGSYEIDVTQKAKGHSLSTGVFTSTTDAVGTGSITFKFGTTDYVDDPESYNSFTQNGDAASITLDLTSSDNSLSGIRDAINDADMGVQATIVKVGTDQYKMVMTSDTGADMSMEITVDDDDGTDENTSGLSQLAFNSSATNLTQVQEGQNALLSINGLDITSSSNQVVGAIPGVTLDLQKADVSETVTLEISQDKSGVKDLITDFVDKYNDMVYSISKYNEYNADTDVAGVLFGESLLRSMEGEVRSIISSAVGGVASGFNSLSNIGITSRVYDASSTTLDEDDDDFERPELAGMLRLDSFKLDEVIEENFDEIGAIFAPVGKPTDSYVNYVTSSYETKAGRYAVNIDQLASKGEYIYAGAGPLDFSSDLTIDDDNNSFSIKLDGITSGTINITNGDYSSGSSLAAEIQSKINGDANINNNGVSVQVSYDDTAKKFTFNSSSYGSSSKVEFVSVDTNTESQLGFAVGSGTDGVDVAGTIGGKLAIGDGQELTGAGSGTQGLMLTITGATTGLRGSVNFSRGLADSMFDLLDEYVKSSGLIDSKIDGIETSVTEIDVEREALELRIEKLESRYLSTFNAMDMLVSQYTSIGSYLTSQLDLLPGVTMFNKN